MARVDITFPHTHTRMEIIFRESLFVKKARERRRNSSKQFRWESLFSRVISFSIFTQLSNFHGKTRSPNNNNNQSSLSWHQLPFTWCTWRHSQRRFLSVGLGVPSYQAWPYLQSSSMQFFSLSLSSFVKWADKQLPIASSACWIFRH